MITVNHYWKDTLTAKVAVEIKTFLPEEAEVKKVFATEEEALNWVRDFQCSQLQFNFMEWLSHKEHIAAHSSWYSESDRAAAMKAAIALTRTMVKWDLLQTCRELVSAQKFLYKILPAPANASYDSSKHRLDEMMDFCTKKLPKLQKVS